MIENIKIPVFPLEEQQQIVEQIEKIDSKINELKEQIAVLEKEKMAIMENSLKTN